MKVKILVCALLLALSVNLAAETKELKGTINSTEVEMDGKKVKSFILKTAEGEFKINKKYASKLKRYEGKTVLVKAEVKEMEIEKLSSLKAVKDKKAPKKTEKKKKK